MVRAALFHHIVGKQHGLIEIFPAVHDPVPDRVDLLHGLDRAVFFVEQRVQYEFERDFVVGHVLLDDRFAAARFVRELGTADTDAFASAFRDHALRIHVDELIFQGRTPRVYD